jgi:hypothetical protein
MLFLALIRNIITCLYGESKIFLVNALSLYVCVGYRPCCEGWVV